MRGLLLRLSTLDTDAESAVRVIAYFDSLVRDHVSVPVLLSATARLTQCPVGLLDAATGRRTRTFPNGHVDHPGTDRTDADRTDTGDRPGGALKVVRELASGLGAVWMERDGVPHGLDEIVLERFAAAAEVTLERAVALAREGRDPALVELALSAETGEAERARALRLLGFDPATPLQALAIAIPADEGFALVPGVRTMGHHVRAARIGDTEAVLVATALPRLPDSARVGTELPDSARVGTGTELPVSARVGIGPELPGSRVAESWAGARTALRFTGPQDRVVRWTELGALALYADVPDAAIAELADVRSMERLGGEGRAAVRALCAEGSVRRAATVLHLHHSSMAARIARAESVLGFSLADSAGRLRAHLALALVRLRANGTTPA
ncbi:PucR family transcriptional regulator [Nonomuraea guangzhouensis]|uniref:PucR family transcriptional regulator n=1 Tax=Nonomuraea guangzhouensis TaxID=1291555 RepID=A0ABW4GVW0_9ACTN|nr:helix-turn-helix domain-containing protein [Nonomuraea guangzhouensis]